MSVTDSEKDYLMEQPLWRTVGRKSRCAGLGPKLLLGTIMLGSLALNGVLLLRPETVTSRMATCTPTAPSAHSVAAAALEAAPVADSGRVQSETIYAHLKQDTPIPWIDESEYFGTTATTELASDAAWEAINIDNGTIALSDEYAERMGLPTSERFPWDESKGIYHVNAFHALHCLKGIRSWVQETRKGHTPHIRVHHVLHCLDALRQDVMCYADDTPRYSGFQHQFRTGTNQTRMCRDWSKLEAWAQQHSACWRLQHDKNPSMALVEEYSHCPPDSPYKAKVDQYFEKNRG